MRLTKTLRRREGIRPAATVTWRTDEPQHVAPPKVFVWRDSPGRWHWIIGRRYGIAGAVLPIAPGGTAPTQPAALALGLAALDTATHRAVHSGGRR